MKKAVFCIFYAGIGGLMALAWPVACYGAIFIFDAPFKNGADEFFRYFAALSIFVYPVFYVLGLLWGIRSLRKGGAWFAILRPFAFLLATPVCVMICFTVVGRISDYADGADRASYRTLGDGYSADKNLRICTDAGFEPRRAAHFGGYPEYFGAIRSASLANLTRCWEPTRTHFGLWHLVHGQ